MFIDYYESSPAAKGWSSCSELEAQQDPQISAEAAGETQTADLTFPSTQAGYVSASVSYTGAAIWLCVGKWSVTVPSSGRGWDFTLSPPGGGSSSSVTVPASDSKSSIALDDLGESLELSAPAYAEMALAAKPQPALTAAQKAAAARKAAAVKAAAKAAAERAHAIYEARLAAENTLISYDQWNDVIRNPDNYDGDIYTISGTVSEYNANSNTLATQESAALVATDGNGNYFVVEAPASLLGNVQPGQSFTAKVTVLGSEDAQNTVYGGVSVVPDFDASTFTIG